MFEPELRQLFEPELCQPDCCIKFLNRMFVKLLKQAFVNRLNQNIVKLLIRFLLNSRTGSLLNF